MRHRKGDFIVKNRIQKLIQLGPIPWNKEISDELFKVYDDLLQTEEPITLEEAGQIINFFSEDCDDLNWGLLHLIESALLLTKGNIKEYRKLIDQCRQSEFREILSIRLENWEKKNNLS